MASKCLVLLCLVAAAWIGADAFATGAPAIACEDMMPLHNVTQQSNPSPYTASVTALGGNRYSFTLTGDASNMFKGVFIQVRDASDAIVGTFEGADNLQVIDCMGGTMNAATHVMNDGKTSIEVVWDGTGGANFVYTTCADVDTFWVKEMIAVP